MKRLIESILSSTKTGKAIYGPFAQFFTDLKHDYPKLKFLYDNGTLIYAKCNLKTPLNCAKMNAIRNLLAINKCDYELPANHLMISEPKENNQQVCVYVYDVYQYHPLDVTYIKSDENIFTSFSALSKDDSPLAHVKEGDLIVRFTKKPGPVPEKSIKFIEQMIKSWK